MQIQLRDLRVGDVVMNAVDPYSVFGTVGDMSPYGFCYTHRPGCWIPFDGLASAYEFWIERDLASRDEVIADLLRVLS